ncbi:SCNM1 protein, partial [Upupa epops]|nr:SCNM1 protein [Upupa epops]
MSFKREGDDPGQLGVLQKRRVADLLANYIPEDEALLLRSGRYACTVCAHRPVFDTLEVLTVHRAGKKHQTNLQGFYRGKQPLRPTAAHREEDEKGEEEGSPAPLLARTRRITHSALLKAAPYSSCCRRSGVEGSTSRSSITRLAPSAAPKPPDPPKTVGATVDASPVTLLPGHSESQLVVLGWPHNPLVFPYPSNSSLSFSDPPTRQRDRSSGKLVLPTDPKPLDPERRRELQRVLQLRSSGWIQDGSGKWVKDENVEFDSDEEEPPPLLP